MTDTFEDILGAVPMKRCNRCDTDKPADREHWYFQKDRPNGNCKECAKSAARNAYHADPEIAQARHKRYREMNPDKIKQISRDWAERNREKVALNNHLSYLADRDNRIEYERERRRIGIAAEQDRVRRAANPERHREKNRRFREANRELLNARQRALRAADPERFREYYAKRYATPKGNLDRRVSASITSALKKRGLSKTMSKGMITGWTIKELAVHLELLFEPGMSFQNYGDWEIDHIIPLIRIPYESEDDVLFKAAWALDNLAPLWASDNSSKHAKIDWQLPDYYTNQRLRAMYAARNMDLLAA